MAIGRKALGFLIIVEKFIGQPPECLLGSGQSVM
jgi:hypothetical protein